MHYHIEHADSPPEVLDSPIVVWDYTGNQYDPANDVLLEAILDFVSHNNGSIAFSYHRITIGKHHVLDGSYDYAPKPGRIYTPTVGRCAMFFGYLIAVCNRCGHRTV